jgi:hypothetical protein
MAHLRDVANEGHLRNESKHLTALGAELVSLLDRYVLVELHVLLNPLSDVVKEVLLATRGLHEDYVVLGVLEPFKVHL